MLRYCLSQLHETHQDMQIYVYTHTHTHARAREIKTVKLYHNYAKLEIAKSAKSQVAAL
jgi:hypothetical protein